MMTVRQIFDDLLGTLGVDNPDTSSATLRASALGYITAGLQLMQTAGEDYYCREELPVSLASGTGYYDLPSTVQTVLKPARLSGGKNLLGLTSRTQLDQFGPLFLGSTDAVEDGTPIAFFVEALKADALAPAAATGNVVVSGSGTTGANGTYTLAGATGGKPLYVKGTDPLYTIQWESALWNLFYNAIGATVRATLYTSSSAVATPDLAASWAAYAGASPAPTIASEISTETGQTDSAKIRLHVIPKPAAGDTLTLNVIKEPPAYTAADLCNGAIPPVPHKYHESILLPICRFNATTSTHFRRNKDKLPQIQADYLRALTILGLADPRKPNPDDSNSNRLKSLASPQQGGQQ